MLHPNNKSESPSSIWVFFSFIDSIYIWFDFSLSQTDGEAKQSSLLELTVDSGSLVELVSKLNDLSI